MADSSKLAKATFGNGCFWCTEAVFQQVHGVASAVSGYSGGQIKNPTYKEVSSGMTGHAEVVQVEFDPTVMTYEQLLDVFWAEHDPTTRDRQGPDVGSQYRSAIFTHDPSQDAVARTSREDQQAGMTPEIVTRIEPLDVFYPAEDYHQRYLEKNGRVCI